MNKALLTKFNLPDAPGVYFFKRGKQILYIGKATNLKDRVKSYFVRDILMTRSPFIAKMLEEAQKIEFIQTDSVLEALILEANLIKKYQPIYNSKEKDDKSYNFVTVTKEEFPKVVITRGSGTYGPFPHGNELREAIKIIRKTFPYRDKCIPYEEKIKKLKSKPPARTTGVVQSGGCFNAQIGLCPGVCIGRISKTEYRKIIKHLKLFFEGKKSRLLKSLEKEMKIFIREYKFEEAGRVKKQLFALGHIQDIALLKRDLEANTENLETNFRIEAYDIAHISGTDVVGVMVVLENRVLVKSQYRKFKIRRDSNNDVANLRETLTRRLAHTEWKSPNLIVVDGGRGQINVAQDVIKKVGLAISVVSVVKDDKHKAREILGKSVEDSTLHSVIFLANAEAHRFAIQYHRKLREKRFEV
ncbi:MAG: hypothetical protein Q7K26_00045 [bacterium]|nr:hypothetical protein [bacterium]